MINTYNRRLNNMTRTIQQFAKDQESYALNNIPHDKG